MREIAVRERNAERRRHADAGRDTAHYLDADAARAERRHLLAAAAEDEGVAAFDASHDRAPHRPIDHQPLDPRL